MRIFDSFIFFNELDLLDLRLNILNDVVDYFVITESPWTVSGNSKPLYYLENKERFSKFEHKIIHNITEEIPNDYSDYMEKKKYHTPMGGSDLNGTPYREYPIRFQRAIFNRDSSIYGAVNFGIKDDDIILTSDADEIINPLVLGDLSWFDPNNHYVCLQKAFYYKLNYLYQDDWMGTRISTFKTLSNYSVDLLRNMHKDAYRIEQAGWHWSFFGDADNFRLKLASYEHTENNVETNTANAERKIDEGIDPFGRSIQIKTIPIDDSYPEYIVNNQEKYAEFIKPWN
jgi:beta-1,4-mannosyl-glycoprotein beta-1,4-N-acetylglucosaminyltransferase